MFLVATPPAGFLEGLWVPHFEVWKQKPSFSFTKLKTTNPVLSPSLSVFRDSDGFVLDRPDFQLVWWSCIQSFSLFLLGWSSVLPYCCYSYLLPLCFLGTELKETHECTCNSLTVPTRAGRFLSHSSPATTLSPKNVTSCPNKAP